MVIKSNAYNNNVTVYFLEVVCHANVINNDFSHSITCLASVSNRIIARKLEREQKKKGGTGRGRGRGRGEEETLARKPHDSGKRPLIFHGSGDL